MNVRLLLSLSFFIAFLGSSFGQTKPPVEHLNSGQALFRKRQFDRALEETRLALAVQYPDSPNHYIGQAYSLIATIHYMSGKLDAAYDSVQAGLRLPLENAPDPAFRLWKLLGTLQMAKGKLDSGEIALKTAAAILKANNWEQKYPSTFNILGSLHAMQGNWPEGLKQFNHYLALIKPKNDTIAISSVYLNIGGVHKKLGDLEQAERDYLTSLAYRRPSSSPQDLAIVYTDLGQLMAQKENFPLAIAYLDTALTLQRQAKDTVGEAISLRNLADVYGQQGDYETATSILRVKLAMRAATIKPYADASDLLALADYLDQAGQPDSVLYFLNTALSTADRIGALDVKKGGLLQRYAFHKKNGNFEAALTDHESYFAVFAQQKKSEANQQMAQERVRFKTQQAESDLEESVEANVELEETNTLYFFLLLTLGLLLVVVAILMFQLRRTKAKLETQNQQLLGLIATKNKFFSIIAHDIRSPLVAFQSIGKRIFSAHQQAKSDKVKRLATQLDQSATQLNGLLNNLLSWALLESDMILHRPQSFPLADVVLDNCDLFSDLAQLKNIRLQADVPQEIILKADENAVHLMIRNLLSNAIKFTPEGGLIKITSFQEANKVVLQISDTGVGIPPEKMASLFSIRTGGTPGTAGEKGTGLGLHLVHELMQLHHGKVNAQARAGHGSVFTLAFPA